MDVFYLDFDGVLCDSATETGVSAWRAGVRLWPDWRGAEPPPETLARFVRLRPALETGYQAPLLMRLAWQGADPGTVFSRFPGLCRTMMTELGATREELVTAFGQVRDEWIAAAPDDWLSRHRFYPGILEKIDRVLSTGGKVYILTTKQKRFALALLRSAGCNISPDRVFGLDAGRPKEDILRELLVRNSGTAVRSVFVEDRLKTLERVAARAELGGIRLCLARWGYVTPSDLERAAALSRIQVLNLDRFPCIPAAEHDTPRESRLPGSAGE